MVTGRQTTFAALLRQYRAAAGLTQENLAERAHLSRRAVSDLERGARTRPWPDTVSLLADALGLSDQQRQDLERSVARIRRAPVSPTRDLGEYASLELTPLLGREREEAGVVHLLQQPHVRLVTLTGVGGVGKTRLALQVARTQGRTFRDGMRFVPLAPLRDSGHVASAIAGALSLQQSRGHTVQATLMTALRQRQALLVLDNFEHVLDAAPLVAEILTACPEVRVLVTSREPLHIRGEQQFPVPPLRVPPKGEMSAGDLSRYPASALFLAQARQVNPGMQLTDGDATAIGTVCRRLDGLPLALELAAAQLKYGPAGELLTHLVRRFDVLVTGSQDRHPRQQTMRACIAWSYDLLRPSERVALHLLAVFAAGCTAEAAQEVMRAAGGGNLDLGADIRALVDKSLLIASWSDGGETRFSILETVRAYALERLEDQGEMGRVYAAYADYYRGLAQSAANAAWGPEEPHLLRRLALERDNIRSVLQWSLQHDIELGLSIGGALVRFWNTDSHYGDWRRWIEEALLMGQTATPSARAHACLSAGWMALQEGDVPVALTRYEEACRLAHTINDGSLTAHALLGRAFAFLSQGDLAAADQSLREADVIAHRPELAHVRAPIMYGRGITAQAGGHLDPARVFLEESVARFRAQGEGISIGSAQRALAGIAIAQGRFDEARGLFHDGLETALAINHRDGIAVAIEGLAAVSAVLGRPADAAWLWGAAEAQYEQLHGMPANGAVPFARLPQLAPYAAAMSARFDDPAWAAAQAEGYEAGLDEILAYLSGEPGKHGRPGHSSAM